MKNNKPQNFISHFLAIGSGTIVNIILGLITIPIITRIVDPDSFGQLSIFNIAITISFYVFELGMDQAFLRYYYQNTDMEYKNKLLFKCIVIAIIPFSIFCILLLVIAPFTNLEELIKIEFILFWIVGVFSQIFFRIAILVIRVQYKSKTYAFLNVLHSVLYLLFSIILILCIKKDFIYLLITATVLSTIITTVIAILFEKSLWNFKNARKNEVYISNKELLKYGASFIVSSGIYVLYSSIDRVLIKFLKDDYEVGIYASAASIIAIFSIIQSTFNTLWIPTAIEHYTKDPNDQKLFIDGNNYISAVMLFLGINIIAFKDIIVYFLGIEYRSASFIIPFLTIMPIMYTVSESTVIGLYLKKKSFYHIYIAVICFLVNVCLSFILIPKLGGRGAAISTGISYILFFLLRTAFSNKFYKIRFKLFRFYIITLLLVVYALYNTFYSINVISALLYLLISTIYFILFYNTIKKGLIAISRYFKTKENRDINV